MSTDPLAEVITRMMPSQVRAEELIRQLQGIRLETLARLLHYRIAEMQDSVQREACYRMLDELSEAQAWCLLCSPALCEALRSRAADTRIVTLLASAHASDNEVPLDEWSVLGDVWLGAEPPTQYPWLEQKEGRFYGPRLACGIPVDFSLPDQALIPSAGLRVARCLLADEISATIEHLDRAVAFMAEMHPFGHQVFSQLVGNIVLRHDVVRDEECWGASSGIAIGRVVVVNALAQPDPRIVGEILLHESTHCAIDCAELYSPFWRNHSPHEDTVLLPSPWTGSELTAHAFAHACIVWAVLLHYWRQCQSRYGADEPSRQRRAFIENGFAKLEEIDLAQTLAPLSSMAIHAVTLAARSIRH